MNKDIQFIGLAKYISGWSKDPSTKCGAIIVDKNNRIVGSGFNGFPRNYPDHKEEYLDRENKYSKIIHAEINAILYSTKILTSCKMYVYPMLPCCRCAAIICNTEINEIISIKLPKELEVRWGESIKITKDLFDKCGKEYREITNIFE